MGYKATEQRPKTTQLVDDDQLNNILGTKMESGQLICSNDYKDYSELEEDTQVGDLIKPQPFESINGRPEGTYDTTNIYSNNWVTVLTPKETGEDSYIFIFKKSEQESSALKNSTLQFTSLAGYTQAQVELVGGGGGGIPKGSYGVSGLYKESINDKFEIKTGENIKINVGQGGESGKNGADSKFVSQNKSLTGAGGKSGISITSNAYVKAKTYKIQRLSGRDNKLYYIYNYTKVQLSDSWKPTYLPLSSDKKEEITLSNGEKLWCYRGAVPKGSYGTNQYYPENSFFRIDGGFEVIEEPSLVSYKTPEENGALQSVKGKFTLIQTNNTYGGNYSNKGVYGYGGNSSNWNSNGKPSEMVRIKIKGSGNSNDCRMYAGKDNFFWKGGRSGSDKSGYTDLEKDDIIGLITSTGRANGVELNFVKNNGNFIKRNSLNVARTYNDKGNEMIGFQRDYIVDYQDYYLVYINFQEENEKQKGCFSFSDNFGSGLPFGSNKNKYFYCWVQDISNPANGTIVKDLSTKVLDASQCTGGDGVVILKLTKPK